MRHGNNCSPPRTSRAGKAHWLLRSSGLGMNQATALGRQHMLSLLTTQTTDGALHLTPTLSAILSVSDDKQYDLGHATALGQEHKLLPRTTRTTPGALFPSPTRMAASQLGDKLRSQPRGADRRPRDDLGHATALGRQNTRCCRGRLGRLTERCTQLLHARQHCHSEVELRSQPRGADSLLLRHACVAGARRQRPTPRASWPCCRERRARAAVRHTRPPTRTYP